MIRIACAGALLALLAACASYAPTVPAGYTGPTAQLRETGAMQGPAGGGQLFYVAAIDGKEVYSSFTRTTKEQQGKGPVLQSMSYVSHTLPAAPMRLKLVGTTVTGAPITALLAAARERYFEVARDVAFTPQPGGSYRVVGKLQAEGSDVWIEDARTAQRVSQ